MSFGGFTSQRQDRLGSPMLRNWMVRANVGKAYWVRFIAQRAGFVGETKVTSKTFSPDWSFPYDGHHRHANHSSLIK